MEQYIDLKTVSEKNSELEILTNEWVSLRNHTQKIYEKMKKEEERISRTVGEMIRWLYSPLSVKIKITRDSPYKSSFEATHPLIFKNPTKVYFTELSDIEDTTAIIRLTFSEIYMNPENETKVRFYTTHRCIDLSFFDFKVLIDFVGKREHRITYGKEEP
jgi:hypothetical protein